MNRFAFLLLAALLVAGPVSAQESFKQVWITQSGSGEVLRGRLVDLSPGSLALLTPDNRRVEISLDHVLRIEARGDSLKNGAAIGAGVMAGLVLLTCSGFGDAPECIPAAIIEAGLGALVGAGIDALNGGRTAIYRRDDSAAGSREGGVPRGGKRAAIGFRIRF